MNVVNRITPPGGIRRVELGSDIIRVETSDGQNRLYRLVSVVGNGPISITDEKLVVQNIREGEATR